MRQHLLAETKAEVFIFLGHALGWSLYNTIHYSEAWSLLEQGKDYCPSSAYQMEQTLLLGVGWTPCRIRSGFTAAA